LNNNPHWDPGDPVVLRGVGFGHLWWAMPATVVQDSPGLVALYWRVGTHWKDTGRHPSGKEILTAGHVELKDMVWDRTDVLLLKDPAEAHSIWLMWETSHQLDCWYVNLETPFRRTRFGFDAMDHELDIVIQADRSGWYWKDEQPFEAMVAAGVFSAQEARGIRGEGDRVIQKLQSNQSPFCDGWEKWSPPADWTIPHLPPGWDLL
jgi:hypothetical protein